MIKIFVFDFRKMKNNNRPMAVKFAEMLSYHLNNVCDKKFAFNRLFYTMLANLLKWMECQMAGFLE